MVEANIRKVADKGTGPRKGIARDLAYDIYSDAAWDLFCAELHENSRPDEPPAVFTTPAAKRLLSPTPDFGPEFQEANTGAEAG